MTLTVKTGLATQKQSDFALILLSGRGVSGSLFTVRSSRFAVGLARRFVLVLVLVVVLVLESGHAE
jgi:hypothetical protein